MTRRERRRYRVLVMGLVVSQHATRADADRAAEKLNRQADQACGEEVWGDGAASVSDSLVEVR